MARLLPNTDFGVRATRAIAMMTSSLKEKYRHLIAILQPMERVAVAFSGGVDSTTLMQAAVESLGADNVLALMSVAPSVPRREIAEAHRLADAMGVRLIELHTEELENPLYVVNDSNRCYFCKDTLFRDCLATAAEHNIVHVLYGAILDDLGDVRPGMRAARQLRIRGPLAEAQMSKADVRELARLWGLDVADKPASACLASRVRHGVAVTQDTLSRVERSEDFLHDLGFRQVRVRHHDDRTARIEVEAPDLVKAAERAAEIHAFLAGVGYHTITLDLAGYRSGSFNPAPASERSDL